MGFLGLSIIFGGKMDNKFKRIIEFKKQKGSIRKPKYATRKLSIGLVSCMLGYALLVSPSSVEAAELEANNQAVEESATEETADTTEETTTTDETTTDETEALADEATPADEAAVPTSNEAPANAADLAPEATDEAPAEEKVAFTLKEAQKQNLKEAGFTDSEIAEIEEEIVGEVEADPKFDTDSFLKVITEQKASEAELGEAKPEPIAADDAITNVEISIGGAKNGEKTTTVNPTASADRIDQTDTDLNLETKIDFDIPEGTKAGRYFDVEISNNVNFNGIVAEEEIIPVMYNGEVVATGERLTDGRRGYRYTFNENIDGLTDVRVSLDYPLFIDPETVPTNSEKETVTVNVAGTEYSKDYKVEYENGVFDYKQGGPTLSGSANIVDVTDNTYEHIIYVNPTGDQEVKNPHLLIQNDTGYKSATFDDEVKNSVKVYRVKNKDNFSLSYHLDYNNLEEVAANAEIVEDLFGSEDDPKQLKVDILNNDFKDDVYVVTYKGKRQPKKATKTLVSFTADRRKFYGEKGNPIETGATNSDYGWKWTNEILFDDPEANATGEKAYDLGDRVWIDANKNGIQDEDEVGVAGVKVTVTGDNINPIVDITDGEGKYLFKQLKNGNYKVTFELPEGYKVTDTNIGDDDEKDSDGLEVTATIKDKDNMSVDLGLVKKEAPVEETYSLGDRVWIDDNKDGIQTEGEKGLAGVTVKLTGEGVEKTTTTDADGNYKFEGLKNGDYKVTFETPEGYDITKTNIGDDDEKDSDGLEVTATIKDKDNMSVDLGLVVKATETPWTPLEPSNPVEPGTPGETPDIPWTPLEPSEPIEPETPGETPETPDKPETPETPEKPVKPENPDKPEKPGKENPTSPEGEKDKKENKVQVPVVEAKKEIKKETPVRKNGNPKTGVGSISGAALGLIAAASGLFVSKKNKDEE